MSEATIPAGFYKGHAVAGSEQYGKTANGHDQIAIEVFIASLNRALTVFLIFSDNAQQYAVDKLRACGWTGDDLLNLTGIDTNEIDVSVKYEPYNGQMKMKVDIYAGGRVKLDAPMDDKDKRAFAARMKGLLKAPPAGAGGRPPTRSQSEPFDPGSIGKDDIPF